LAHNFGWDSAGRLMRQIEEPIIERKQEPAIREGLKLGKKNIRIQPLLRSPMCGVDGGLKSYFAA